MDSHAFANTEPTASASGSTTFFQIIVSTSDMILNAGVSMVPIALPRGTRTSCQSCLKMAITCGIKVLMK
ncbi:hypothetical protein D3C75_1280480 [compost metagenome]